jgi:hypothetical protein
MVKLSEVTNHVPRILVYGFPGTGKTAFMLTAGSGLLVCDIDDGLQVGKNLEDRWKEARMNVEVEQFKDENPLVPNSYRRFKAFITSLSDKVRLKKPLGFDILGIDSLTSLADGAMRYILSNSSRLGGTPQLQDWGLAFVEIDNLLMQLKVLPVPVVLLAHQQTNEIDDKTHIELGISGKRMPQKVAGMFDEVLYSKTIVRSAGKVDFVLQTVSTGSIMCRSRSCVADGFDQNAGIRKLISMCGYEFPPKEEVKVK